MQQWCNCEKRCFLRSPTRGSNDTVEYVMPRRTRQRKKRFLCGSCWCFIKESAWLFGSGSRRQTFRCFRSHVLAGWLPSHANLWLLDSISTFLQLLVPWPSSQTAVSQLTHSLPITAPTRLNPGLVARRLFTRDYLSLLFAGVFIKHWSRSIAR
jgi:hypothetical protein